MESGSIAATAATASSSSVSVLVSLGDAGHPFAWLGLCAVDQRHLLLECPAGPVSLSLPDVD